MARLRHVLLVIAFAAALACSTAPRAYARARAPLERVTTGGLHGCAVLASGHIQCWGINDVGELGDGSTITAVTPVEVQGITDAAQVAAGRESTCALLDTGHVECWGSALDGLLGNGATSGIFDTPTEVSSITDATQLSVGSTHACAVLSTGHIDCWGNDESGQLGDGLAGGVASAPVEVASLTTATEVAAGQLHTCAVLSSGHVECWGANATGELGDGTTTSSDTPVEVSSITDATQVAAGINDDTCAVLATGHLDCWGSNAGAELGTEAIPDYTDTPAEVPGIANAVQVAPGFNYTCVTLASGDVACWGSDEYGQLGNATTTAGPDFHTSPGVVVGLATASQVAAGIIQTCAALSSGSVECWGSNLYGMLGDGTVAQPTTPAAVQGLTNATSVSAGPGHACAVLSTGTARCWGSNEYYGALGDGTFDGAADAPEEVLGISNAEEIAAGPDDTCVLSTGGISCWGSGNVLRRGEEVIANAVQIVTAESITCALFVGGELECWTRYSAGHRVPITNATQLTAGSETVCALLSTGAIDCWGDNDVGQLGDGKVGREPEPVQVSGITNATQVAAGGEDTCAVLRSGSIDCWGGNRFGQLGTGTASEYSTTPVEVQDIADADQVATSGETTCAVLSTGNVDCWGARLASLEAPPNAPNLVPSEVPDLSDAVKVSVGEHYACALLANRNIECWGENGGGQLGTGTAWSTTPTEAIVAPLPRAATAQTQRASDPTQGSITLNATVNPEGREVTECYFEYGLTTAYGSDTPCQVSPGAGTDAVTVSASVADLDAGTSYHFRIVAANVELITEGSDETFTPLATSASATNDDPEAPAIAEDGPLLLAEASGGTGTVTVGSYSALPAVGSPPTDGSGGYVDVYLSAESTFTRVHVRVCEPLLIGGSGIQWFNEQTSQYEALSSQEGPTGQPACMQATVEASTKPDLAQLTGTVLAATITPGAAPGVKKLSTKKGPATGGTSVTITGSGFAGVSSVKFGTAAATRVTFNSDASVTAIAPPATSGTVSVTVSSPNGTSNASSKQQFTYGNPTITILNPGVGPPSGGTKVTVRGSGFAIGAGHTDFLFGKTAGTSVTCSSTTECAVEAPAGKAGTVDVVATVGKLKSKRSPAGTYTYG